MPYPELNPWAGLSANDLYSVLTRQQWQDYVTNFVPYENKLIEYATDPSVVSNAMSEASQDVGQSFDNQAASSARQLRSLGLTLDGDEQRAAQRSLGLARSLADVNAQNTARDVTMARQRSILGNPAPRIPTAAGGM